MSSNAQTPVSAGRPRSEEAHQAILDATLALLVEAGFSGLTVEGVATRAGVGKATIYRRWPSKLHLVIEAFRQLPGLAEVDTGDLVEDLEQMLGSYLRILNDTPLAAVMPSLAGERAHNPELSELIDPILRGRRKPVLRALERAVERGEVRDDLDLELVADLIFGPIAMRVFFAGARINPKLVRPAIELVLKGITPRAGASD
ncbi:MAG: TetR/AcrR family transcriptional regulator [Deltaproteobacteria bacterium]|nr:MAG: TetR/AcrR family transcriptional regulator [Deltaproteobacteria bacterium]